MRQFVVALLAAVVGGIAGAFLATGRGAPPADPSEAYLAANEEAGTMISLKEWREKAPPRFDWDH